MIGADGRCVAENIGFFRFGVGGGRKKCLFSRGFLGSRADTDVVAEGFRVAQRTGVNDEHGVDSMAKRTTRSSTGRKTAAKKPAAKKPAAKAKAAKAAKPAAKIGAVSKPRTKGELFSLIADHNELSRKQVAGVFDTLGQVIAADLKNKSLNHTTAIPGMMKIIVQRKPATKARKGINPFTGEETMFKAKPARNVVKIRPLKGLKEMV